MAPFSSLRGRPEVGRHGPPQQRPHSPPQQGIHSPPQQRPHSPPQQRPHSPPQQRPHNPFQQRPPDHHPGAPWNFYAMLPLSVCIQRLNKSLTQKSARENAHCARTTGTKSKYVCNRTWPLEKVKRSLFHFQFVSKQKPNLLDVLQHFQVDAFILCVLGCACVDSHFTFRRRVETIFRLCVDQLWRVSG